MVYGLVALWPCGFMALWPYDHAYVMYIYDKCWPLNLCQNMQKKVKMDCIHNMPIRGCLVRRLLEQTTRPGLKVSVSTLSVAPAFAGI